MARRKMIDGTPATSTEADLEVANKELVPAGPPNSANDKADIDNDGQLSEYELARSAAIMKAMAKREKSG